MKVIDAVDQARMARLLLQSIEALRLEDIQSSIEVIQVFIGQRSAKGARNALNAYRTLHDIASVDAPELLRRDIDNFHPELEHYLKNLSDQIVNLISFLQDGIEDVGVSITIPNDNYRLKVLSLLAEIGRTLQSIDEERDLLVAFLRAWEVFSTPNAWEPDTHTIVLNVSARTLSLDSWKESIAGIDGLFVLLLILEGRLDLLSAIRIERFEAGSLGISLKVPDEVWQPILRGFRRLINAKSTELDDRQKETETLMLGVEALAKLKQQRDEGKINEAMFHSASERLAHVHHLNLKDTSVEADGQTMVNETLSPQALSPPREQLALPPGGGGPSSGDSDSGEPPPPRRRARRKPKALPLDD